MWATQKDRLYLGGAAYAETSVMGAVSGGGAAGTSFSSLGASLGASGSGTGFGGLVILRGSRLVICSPYCFLMSSHLIWMKKQDRFKASFKDRTG